MSISYTRGFSPDDLKVKFKTYKNRVGDALEAVSQKSAEDVMELSKAYAPVDEGDLENAHRVVERTTRIGNPIFDVTFYDDATADYAEWIHESTYNLGPLSEEKARSTGMPVGRRFLYRAMEKLKPEILDNYRKALAEALN